MQVVIDGNIYSQAQAYAQQNGQNLNKLIENFLLLFIQRSNRAASEEPVPDVVASLLGAGLPLDAEDINGREAYSQYLEEKYK